MAQISKGIELGYYGGPEHNTPTRIPDIKSVPALGSTPNTQQTTTLTDSMHTYIEGLADVGGALEFTCNYTPAVVNAVNTAIEAQASNGGKVKWFVNFPAPLNKSIQWEGAVAPVYNTDVSVDAVVEGTVAIVPHTALTSSAFVAIG